MGKRQGKGARQRAKERRKRDKRARKEARQIEWQGLAARGQNKKKKKHNRGKKRSVRNERHATAYCGNLGCCKCNPKFSDAFQAKPGTALYRKRWTSAKAKANV